MVLFTGLIYESGLNPEFTETESVGTAEDRVVVDSITSKSIALHAEAVPWGVVLGNGVEGL